MVTTTEIFRKDAAQAPHSRVMKILTNNPKHPERRILSLNDTCGVLASQISNSLDSMTILVKSFEIECSQSQYFSFNSANVTLRPESIATLKSNDSKIFVSSTNIVLSGITFSGRWNLFVSRNSSLTLRDIAFDHAAITLAAGAAVTIDGLAASRSEGAYPALAISASHATVNIANALIQDDLSGVLLSISGDFANVSIKNVSILSWGNIFVPNSSVGITVSGSHLLVDIFNSSIKFCGNGGVYVDGDASVITMNRVILFGNVASVTNGGGLSIIGRAQSLIMIQCQVVGNNALFDGAGIAFEGDDGNLDIRDSLLNGNQAVVNGGAIVYRGSRGNIRIFGCQMSFNIAFTLNGGAMLVDSDGGKVTITNCNMTRNICVINGGAFALAADLVRISGCLLDRNIAVGGGGAYISAQQAVIRNSNFTRNTASTQPGGGVWFISDIEATLNVSDSSFSANFGTDGGGIAVGPCVCSAVLAGVHVSSNIAQGAGGGLSYVGAAAETGVRGGMVEVIGSAFDSNAAQLGPGGGISVVSSAFRIVGTSVSANRAGLGGGGGIAVTGSPSGPSPSEEAMWLIAQSKVSGNAALGNGGGILASNMSSPPKLIANGSGVPFAFGPGGESVLCRGTGNINDLDVTLQRFVPNGSECIEVLHSYDASVAALGVSDPEALALAVSADLSVLLVYLNYAFQVVAFRMADNVILGSFPTPPNPSFELPNESSMVPSTQYPLFVPLVANTDFNDRAIYGGWALSYAEGAGRLFASTFHRTLEYNIASHSFRELVGCSGGVSAMVFSEADQILHLARFTNIGLAFNIYFYDPASGQCTLRKWGTVAPLFQMPIRALGISSDGKRLFFAEDYKNADNATQTDEDQILKIVDLSSGVISLMYQGPGSGLVLNTVIAILQPTGWSGKDIMVLTAPGGFQYGPFGTDPAQWSIFSVQMGGELHLLNSTLDKNYAQYSGGGIAAMDDAVFNMTFCSVTNNSAGQFGGGTACLGESVTTITYSNLTVNSALVGAGLGLSDLAHVQVSDSRFSWNHAGDCGGAIGTSSSLPLMLLGSVSFISNFAENFGGALCVQADQQQQSCINQTNIFMMSMDSDSSITATQNEAGRAGGALYDSCWQFQLNIPLVVSISDVGPDPATARINSHRSVSPLPSGWLADGTNKAPYGPLVATGPGTVLVITNAPFSYSPGQELSIVLAMIDG